MMRLTTDDKADEEADEEGEEEEEEDHHDHLEAGTFPGGD